MPGNHREHTNNIRHIEERQDDYANAKLNQQERKKNSVAKMRFVNNENVQKERKKDYIAEMKRSRSNK